MDFWKSKGAAIGTALLTFGALIFLCRSLLKDVHQLGVATEAIRMTSIIVVGLAAIVALVIVLVLVYKDTGLEDKTQALGLPVGSVRALIAFVLLLMFVSLGVFLYQQTSATCVGKSEANITLDQYKALSAQFIVTIDKTYPPPDTPVKAPTDPKAGPAKNKAFQPAAEAKGHPASSHATEAATGSQTASATGNNSVPNPDAAANPYPAGTHFDVTFYPGRSKEADDLAKQMFTQLATVLITVVGFYFGSSATTAGVNTGVKLSNQQNNP